MTAIGGLGRALGDHSTIIGVRARASGRGGIDWGMPLSALQNYNTSIYGTTVPVARLWLC